MTKEERLKYIRQSEIISLDKLQTKSVSIIGAGSVGSFTALILGKMGVKSIKQYDEDGVSDINLPGQFFRYKDVGQFKTECLNEILTDFTDVKYKGINKFYKSQALDETMIVCTDSLPGRKLLWEQFLKQDKCKYYIDSRMGAELGKIFTIRDKSKASREFYEETLEGTPSPLPCTARTIIYNVAMVSSFIARAYKAIVMDEKFPREIIFNLREISEYSVMVRE